MSSAGRRMENGGLHPGHPGTIERIEPFSANWAFLLNPALKSKTTHHNFDALNIPGTPSGAC